MAIRDREQFRAALFVHAQKYGASVEACGGGAGTSPLMTALAFGHQDAAETLVRRGESQRFLRPRDWDELPMPTGFSRSRRLKTGIVRSPWRRSTATWTSSGCCSTPARIRTAITPKAITATPSDSEK
jgi:hypothetical protein